MENEQGFTELSDKQKSVYAELENLLFDFKNEEISADYSIRMLLEIVKNNVPEC